jgi:hypothetical protein
MRVPTWLKAPTVVGSSSASGPSLWCTAEGPQSRPHGFEAKRTGSDAQPRSVPSEHEIGCVDLAPGEGGGEVDGVEGTEAYGSGCAARVKIARVGSTIPRVSTRR